MRAVSAVSTAATAMPTAARTAAKAATALGCAVLLAACSGSSGGTASGDNTSSSTSSTTSSSSSSTTSSSSSATTTGQAVATNLDPCTLVTRAEASKLAGITFRPGKEQRSGKGKQCVYGSQTVNVFTVEVVQVDDAAAARADFDAERAQAQAALKKAVPAGLTVSLDTSNVDGIGDKAAIARASAKISGTAFSVSGIYVLKGTTFFAFQDLTVGKPSTSNSDLKDQARTVLGRI